MSLSSELESHCLCASLFTIFFEPRMSVVQGKLYKTFLTMSIERQAVGREPHRGEASHTSDLLKVILPPLGRE